MTTTTRPTEFDNRVMAFMPGLYNLARKYKRTAEDRYDLVTDTIAYALEKWQNFREDGGMYNWLAWNMRGIASNQRKRNYIHVVEAKIQYDGARTNPNQQDYAELSSALRLMPAGHGGTILMRRAMGETRAEIGADYGFSHQRVHQIEVATRAKLRKRAGLKVAA